MTPTKNGTHQSNALGKPSRIIVLGFYDGPTDGVIQFGNRGPTYRFIMPVEDHQLSANGRERDYLFQPLPADALDRIATILEVYHTATWPLWCPAWRFPSAEIEAEVEAKVDVILAEAGPAEWRISTDSVIFDPYRAACLTAAHNSGCP